MRINQMTKRLLLSLLGRIVVLISIAQDLPSVIPPSPTVANLMSFEETPIDHHTGQPDISLPIFSKQVDKDLIISGVLRYSTQGIKLDNRSGWTGTGWSLSVGGVVTRTVRDVPDEYSQEQDGRSLGVFHNDAFWNEDYFDITQNSADNIQTFYWNAVGTSSEYFETQPDLYQYSYPGGSGRFMIEKVGSALVPRLMTSGESVKIDVTYDTSYKLNSFQITDTKGYKYFFEDIELISNDIYTLTRTQKDNTPEDRGVGYNTSSSYLGLRSSWHLSKILNPNNVEIATFNYHPLNLESYQMDHETTNTITATDLPVDGLQNICNNEILRPSWMRVVTVVNADVLNLESIQFVDGTRVELAVGSTDHPETGGNVLDNVKIIGTDGTVSQQVDLDTEVINGRLWLNNVIQNDMLTNQTKTYTLAYKTPNQLPPHTTFGNFVEGNVDDPNHNPGKLSDSWGYFNDSPGSNTNISKVTTGLLQSIKYPTGGSKEFVWESNTFSYGGGGVISQSQIDASHQSVGSDPVFNNLIYNGTSTPSNNNGIIATSLVVVDFDQEVYLDLSQELDTATINPIPENPLLIRFRDVVSDSVFQTNIDRYPSNRTSYSIYLPAGTYTVELALLIELGNFDVDINIRFSHKKVSAAASEGLECAKYGGGVRIREVRYREGFDVFRKFLYDYSVPSDECKSSGSVDGILGSLSNLSVAETHKYLFGTAAGLGCQAGGNHSNSFNARFVDYKVKSNGVRVHLSKGNYVGYKHVKVSEENNGYTTYEYTNSHDYPQPQNVLEDPLIPPKYLDHKRGLLLKREMFNLFGHILLSEENDYVISEEVVASAFKVMNDESCSWSQFYDSYTQYQNKNFALTKMPRCEGTPPIYCDQTPDNCGETSQFYRFVRPIIIGWSRLDVQLTKDYFNEGSDNITKKRTFAYNVNNYQPSEIKERFKEAGDSVILITRYLYPVSALPIFYSDMDGVNALNSINKVNEVIYSESLRIDGPDSTGVETLLGTTMKTYYNTWPGLGKISKVLTAKGTNELEERMEIHAYDGQGNVLEVSSYAGADSDMHSVFLWGYNQSVPIAKIDDISWDDIPLEIRNNIGTASESMIISYLNDLRTIHFPDKQITSFFYDNNLRLKEVTDPNDQSVTYEYDGLGRLLRTRDHDGNLVQEVTYQTKTNE